MPSDIQWNATSQLPYLNQPFDLVRAEAEEAGFTVEHWDGDDQGPRGQIHILRARGPMELILYTRGGLVKKMGHNAWHPTRD